MLELELTFEVELKLEIVLKSITRGSTGSNTNGSSSSNAIISSSSYYYIGVYVPIYIHSCA